MTISSDSYSREVAAARAHTADYGTNAEFRKYWLGFTQESRNLRAQQLRVLGELLESVGDTLAGWRILDVGCGDGRWLRTLVEFDARPEDVVGIDASNVRFDIGRAKNPLVKLVQTDGVSIPFDAEHFDLITQFLCFSNIPTLSLRTHTAKEMARVLKPGGYIFWWDLRSATAPTDTGARIEPTDYFEWPIARREIGPHPKPSEALRYFPGVRFVRPFIDRLSKPATYTAALIGPKP
jgi:ubiquinone/menaquinone biosynthesis C-methylase UbiE